MTTPPSAAPPPALPSQRHLFDIPREVTYLNCAYMSPLLREAVEVGRTALARKAHPWTIPPAYFFELTDECRALFARLLGATPDDVALVPSVSYGMATAAANLPVSAGQRVLMLDEEFPSVIYPWRARARAAGAEAVLIRRPPDDDWTGAVLAAIDERTAVAALPACHWTDGALVDLVAIGRRLRDVGATLAIDATQSLGAMPFDLDAVRPDFLAAAAYKWLLGPYAIGFLYVDPRWQGGQPMEQGWFARAGSQDFAGLVNYRDEYQPGARRFDMGEASNFALLPAAGVALRQIMAWGVPRIARSLSELTALIEVSARARGFVAVDAARRAPHYLGLRRAGGLPAGLGDALSTRQVFVSTRGSALRVTPHVYNDAEDVARFDAALAELA